MTAEPIKCCGVIVEGIVCPFCLEWVPDVRHLDEAERPYERQR